MAGHRRYTRREKATAVIAAEMTNATAAAEAVGIPETTIRYWMDDPRFAELRSKTREDAVEGFGVLMHAAQSRLLELMPRLEPRDLIILLGVATDKAQLLAGKPTDITGNVDLTDGIDDHERALLGEAIRGELARRADEHAAEDAVGAAGEAGSAPTAG